MATRKEKSEVWVITRTNWTRDKWERRRSMSCLLLTPLCLWYRQLSNCEVRRRRRDRTHTHTHTWHRILCESSTVWLEVFSGLSSSERRETAVHLTRFTAVPETKPPPLSRGYFLCTVPNSCSSSLSLLLFPTQLYMYAPLKLDTGHHTLNPA